MSTSKQMASPSCCGPAALGLLAIGVVLSAATAVFSQDAVITVEKLIEHLAASETRFQNVRVHATWAELKRTPPDDQWSPYGSGTVTAVFQGGPGGKFRLETDSLAPWTDGPAPFCQTVAVEAFDGRVKRTLTLKNTVPDARSIAPPQGLVEDKRRMLYGIAGSGWPYSLYGARDARDSAISSPQRLSAYLRRLAAENGVQILFNRLPHDDSFYWQAVIHRNGRNVEGWSFDPDHGYALRRFEQWSPDGKVHRAFNVDKIKEVAPGVFWPVEVTGTYPGLTGGEVRTHVQVGTAEANIPDLSDAVFSIAWPVGTIVEDKVAGRTFVVAQQSPAPAPTTNK
jgi:hypothetical protein